MLPRNKDTVTVTAEIVINLYLLEVYHFIFKVQIGSCIDNKWVDLSMILIGQKCIFNTPGGKRFLKLY